MLHALYLGPSQGKWVTSVYCIVRLGIVRLSTQTALHSTRRMCTWARQGRNVWIVGVVGEKQTPPVIPPIPASSMSADVDLTKLGTRSQCKAVFMSGTSQPLLPDLPSFHSAGSLFFPRSLRILLRVPTPLLHGTGSLHLRYTQEEWHVCFSSVLSLFMVFQGFIKIHW